MVEKIKNGEIGNYSFGTTIPMDSYWSMDYFIKEFNLSKRIVKHDGDYVEFDFGYSALCGGGEYEHVITFEKL